MTAAIIDYHDSFTYNIEHLLTACDVSVDVIGDEFVVLDDLAKYDMIILSPGPGLPEETSSMFQIMERYASLKPILGICLGMQGITQFFRGKIYNQEFVKHGVQVAVNVIKNDALFDAVPDRFLVGLYHSWACELNERSELIELMKSDDDVVMAVRHNVLPVYGLQFHPESVLTEYGQRLLLNFVTLGSKVDPNEGCV